MKMQVGKTFKLKEDSSFFVKEGHEVGGFSKATTISAGNSVTIVGERPHGWFEAQVRLTERYTPPYGGEAIRWRGIILVRGDQVGKFSAVGRAS